MYCIAILHQSSSIYWVYWSGVHTTQWRTICELQSTVHWLTVTQEHISTNLLFADWEAR